MLLLLLSVLFLHIPPGNTCNCVPVKSIQKEFLNSSSVFVGKVVSISKVRSASPDSVMQYRVVFELVKGYKNAWKKRIQIITPTEQECGLQFRKDLEYLVFAVGGLMLETNQCTRTRELPEADIDVMVLNALMENPVTEETEDKSKNE